MIDLKEISYFIQHDDIGSILGGRYDLYNHLLKQLCKNLCRNGAKLVFFMVGKRYTDDLSIFVTKAEFRHNNSMDILNKMRDHTDIKSLTTKKLLQCSARDSHAFTYNFQKLLRRFGDIRVTHVEHNREIAQYLNKNSDQVLALISNDTDFLAFEGDFELWLTADLNLKQMTCHKVEKEKLFDRLGFNYGAHQMKLLSALSGTVYLPIEQVINFITELNNNRHESSKIGKIWAISEYVRRESIEMVNNKPQFDLDKISGDVFGPDHSDWQRQAISNGLDIYRVDFNDDELKSQEMENEFLSFCKERNPFLFKLAADEVYVVKDISFIDYENYRSKTYSQLVIPILMKIWCILFQNDYTRSGMRQIFMKHNHDEPFKTTEEFVIYPPSKASHSNHIFTK